MSEQMQFEIKPELEQRILSRIGKAGCNSAEDVIESALQIWDEIDRDNRHLAQLIREGVESAEPPPFTQADWDHIRGQVRTRISDRSQ